jgi:hypothetical protein
MFGVQQQKNPDFCLPLSLAVRKKYVCNTGSNHAIFVVNKLAFYKLSILVQK